RGVDSRRGEPVHDPPASDLRKISSVSHPSLIFGSYALVGSGRDQVPDMSPGPAPPEQFPTRRREIDEHEAWSPGLVRGQPCRADRDGPGGPDPAARLQSDRARETLDGRAAEGYGPDRHRPGLGVVR